ncbi:unnamed protein product [Arabidopsis halleri]
MMELPEEMMISIIVRLPLQSIVSLYIETVLMEITYGICIFQRSLPKYLQFNLF